MSHPLDELHAHLQSALSEFPDAELHWDDEWEFWFDDQLDDGAVIAFDTRYMNFGQKRNTEICMTVCAIAHAFPEFTWRVSYSGE